MTAGKASAFALGLAGAFALGSWAGPDLWTSWDADDAAPMTVTPTPTESVPAPRVPTEAAAPASDIPSSTDAPVLTISASAEPVQRRARALLAYGTDVKAAANGFSNAEQFMTVAYAARNTDIPFVLLKHRLLTEGKSLAEAIRELKPGLDATLEANRARLEARSALSRLD